MKLGKDGWPTDEEVIKQRDKELAAANERIKMLTEAEAVMRRNAHEWKDAFTAERTALERERLVSDKLETALNAIGEYYAGINTNVAAQHFRTIANTALAEVERLRNANPAIQ